MLLLNQERDGFQKLLESYKEEAASDNADAGKSFCYFAHVIVSAVFHAGGCDCVSE